MIERIDLFGHQIGKSTRGNDGHRAGGFGVQFRLEPGDHAFDQIGKSENEARLHSSHGTATYNSIGCDHLDPPELGRVPEHCICGNLQSRRNCTADVIAIGSNGVENGCCAYVDSLKRTAVEPGGSDGVDEPVDLAVGCAELRLEAVAPLPVQVIHQRLDLGQRSAPPILDRGQRGGEALRSLGKVPAAVALEGFAQGA